jgi:hypothetical protein
VSCMTAEATSDPGGEKSVSCPPLYKFKNSPYKQVLYNRVRQHAAALNGVLYELSHYEQLNRRK